MTDPLALAFFAAASRLFGRLQDEPYLLDMLRYGQSAMEPLTGAGNDYWLACRLVPIGEVADTIEGDLAKVAPDPEAMLEGVQTMLESWVWLPPD